MPKRNGTNRKPIKARRNIQVRSGVALVERRRRPLPAPKMSDVEYPPGLPFEVHLAGVIPGCEGMPTDAVGEYHWTGNAAGVAEEALERGYVLSVPVPIESVAQATALIVQNLTRSTFARYDEKKHRLLVWDEEPGDGLKDRTISSD